MLPEHEGIIFDHYELVWLVKKTLTLARPTKQRPSFSRKRSHDDGRLVAVTRAIRKDTTQSLNPSPIGCRVLRMMCRSLVRRADQGDQKRHTPVDEPITNRSLRLSHGVSKPGRSADQGDHTRRTPVLESIISCSSVI